MKKLLCLIILMLVTQLAFAKGPWIMGDPIKALKDNVQMKNGVSRLSGVLDPTSAAVSASVGSTYQSYTTGKLYVKTDAGLTTNWNIVASAADVSNALSAARSSHLVTGCDISVNGVDSTQLDISACRIDIVDNTTDPENPVVTKVDLAPQTISITNLATQNATLLSVDATGTVKQSDSLIAVGNPRSNVFIGTAIHISRVQIDGVNNIALGTGVDPAMFGAEFLQVFGPINYAGNNFSPSTGLTIDKTSGVTWGYNGNYKVDRANPNFVQNPACTTCSWFYSWRDGSGGWNSAFTNTLNPSRYDDGTGGETQPNGLVSNNKYTITRLYGAGATTLIFQYGQKQYNTREEAVNDILLGIAIPEQDPGVSGTTPLGWIVTSGAATTTTASDFFVARPNFSGAASGSVQITDWSLTFVTSATNPNLISTCKNIVIADASAGDVTITLPDSATSNADCSNKFILGAGPNTATVTTQGGTQLIGGATTQVIYKVNKGFETISDPTNTQYRIIQDSRAPFEVDANKNVTTDAAVRTDAIYGNNTDPFNFAVQDGLNYNATDSSMQGSASVSTSEVAFNLRIATLTGDASTTGSLMAFDAVTDPELLKDAWHTVFINYGISGSVSEQYQCAIYDNGVKIAGQYEPKLSGNGNQNAIAKIQFLMSTSPTKLQPKCEQLVAGTETLTVSKIIWSKKPEDQISLPKGAQIIKISGYTSKNASNNVKFKTSQYDKGSDGIVYFDNTGDETRAIAKKASIFNIGAGIKIEGSEAVGKIRRYNSSGTLIEEFSIYDNGANAETNMSVPIYMEAGEYIAIGSTFGGALADDVVTTYFVVQATPIGADTGVVAEGEIPSNVVILKDVKASGTNGGSSVEGSLQRDLNTIEGNTSIIKSLSLNQFTLTKGVYQIEISAPAYGSNRHKVSLKDVTNTLEYYGESSYAILTGQATTSSTYNGQHTITSDTTFEVRHTFESAQADNGLGVASIFGVNEVYTQVKITKLSGVGPTTVVAKSAVDHPFEERFLSANVTTTGVVSDLTFTDLVVGDEYTVSGLLRRYTGSSIIIEMYNGSQQVYWSRLTATTVNVSDSPSFKFTATDTTLTVNITTISGSSGLVGNGSKGATFLQLKRGLTTGFIATSIQWIKDFVYQYIYKKDGNEKEVGTYKGCPLYEKSYDRAPSTEQTNPTLDTSIGANTVTPRDGVWRHDSARWRKIIDSASTLELEPTQLEISGVAHGYNVTIQYTKNSECP